MVAARITLAAWAALLVLPVLGVGLLHGFAYARAYPSSLMAELLGVESADGVQRGLLTLEQMSQVHFLCVLVLSMLAAVASSRAVDQAGREPVFDFLRYAVPALGGWAAGALLITTSWAGGSRLISKRTRGWRS